MKQNIRLEIELYGPLKDFLKAQKIHLEVATGANSVAVIQKLEEHLCQNTVLEAPQKQRLNKLLAESVLAGPDKIFQSAEIFNHDCKLAVLPPVCGG